MEKLQFKTIINAPVKKVWNTMLNDSTYREWTKSFHAGSYFEGSWDQGSDIQFLAKEEDGKSSGMYSRIKENRRYEFISIQHLGEISKGIKTPWPVSSEFNEGLENYSFREVDGGTELTVEMDSPAEYKEMFEGMWPKALATLKDLSEKSSVNA